MLRVRNDGVVLAVSIATLSLSACKPQASADVRLADRVVQVATVEPGQGTERAYTGIVAARVQSDLGFRVQGKVVARLVDTGQVVVAGQALMRIDPTDYTHAITAQQGDVAAARARLVQAAADEKRYRGLVASGAESQHTYDQAKAAADSARALLDAAEAQEKVARNQGDYAVLLADADGTVVETLVEPGQVVSPGQTVVRLAHAGPREAAVNLPEAVRPPPNSVAEASLYGGTARVAARLRQLSDAADPRTRTYEARYVLQGNAAQAPIGATVRIHLRDAERTAALQVPLGAIDDEGAGPGVWIVDPETRLITRRPVKVSAIGAESAELTGGVRAGELVASMTGPFLHDGDRVQLADQKAAMR